MLNHNIPKKSHQGLFRWTILGIGLLPGLLCLLAGCGTGDYEQKLRNRKTTSKFDDFMKQPVDARLSVQIPKSFSLLNKGGGVNDKRVEPGLLGGQWLKRTYETFVKEGDGEKPCYCYIGSLEKVSLADAEMQFRSYLNIVKDKSVTEWGDFQGEMPDMHDVKWRKLRCTAPMEFCCKDNAGKEKIETVPGVLEVYLREEGGVVAVAAWKLPASIEQNVKLGEISKLVAGSVVISK